MALRKLHAFSALLVAAFACLHLVNHLAGVAGIEAHLAFMKVARSVYRHGWLEPVLLGCITLQVLSGLALVVRGWKRRRGRVAWLQLGSGVYLAFFLLVHVGAVLFGRAGSR